MHSCSSLLALQLPQCLCAYLAHLISHLQNTLLMRCLIISMLGVACGSSDSSSIPERYLPATWIESIVPACVTDYSPQPRKAFSRAAWGYWPQLLLSRETCSTHFKQNAKIAIPGQIRWKGDQNPLHLPYHRATGCWSDCSCVLRADPHTAKTHFNAPCEVMRLEDKVKNPDFLQSNYRRNQIQGIIPEQPNEKCV